jgi:hypothetical protein
MVLGLLPLPNASLVSADWFFLLPTHHQFCCKIVEMTNTSGAQKIQYVSIS